MKFSTKQLVTTAMLGALSVLIVLTPLGFIPWFGGASLTIMHIPTIIAAILEGPIAGTIVGFIFGVTSMIKASTPIGPLDPLFTNPLVSIVPRLFIGIATWLVFKLFRGRHNVLASICAGIAGSITNTVLVLIALASVFTKQMFAILNVSTNTAMLKIIALLAATNGIVEAVVAAICSAAIIQAWKGIEKGRSKLES